MGGPDSALSPGQSARSHKTVTLDTCGKASRYAFAAVVGVEGAMAKTVDGLRLCARAALIASIFSTSSKMPCVLVTPSTKMPSTSPASINVAFGEGVVCTIAGADAGPLQAKINNNQVVFGPS